MLTIPITAPVDPVSLTTEARRALLSVEGLDVQAGVEVRFYRVSGEFSASEQTALQQVLTNHDGVGILAAKAQRIADATTELNTTTVKTITVAQVDSIIDAIGNLADLKTFLKKLVRYLIAQQQVRG